MTGLRGRGLVCRFLDNPRFGLDGWMRKFDGRQHKYKLGVELTKDDKVKCEFCHNELVYEAAEAAEKPPVWYKPHRYVRQAIDGLSGRSSRSVSASPGGSPTARAEPRAHFHAHAHAHAYVSPRSEPPTQHASQLHERLGTVAPLHAAVEHWEGSAHPYIPPDV